MFANGSWLAFSGDFDTEENKYTEKQKVFSINGEKFSHQALAEKAQAFAIEANRC